MSKKKHKSLAVKIIKTIADIVGEFIELIISIIAIIVIVIVLAYFIEIPTNGELVNKVQDTVSQISNKSETSTVAGVEVEEVTVTEVIDGDTIKCSNGETVRMIGINTPESTTEQEPYGKEAHEYTEDQLLNQTVWLTKDVSEEDLYDRSLRFVWTEKPENFTEDEFRTKCFNAELVLNGYATASTYEPDDTYAEYFRKFDREAHDENIGLWSIDPKGTTSGDFTNK